MFVEDANFRDLYLNYVVIKSKEDGQMQERFFNIESILSNFDEDDISMDDIKSVSIDKDVNGVLVVPYIDHQAGMSFLVLATVLIENDDITIYKRDNLSTFQVIRYDQINDKEFVLLDDLNIVGAFNQVYYENYANEVLSNYSNENLNILRDLDLIDSIRNKNYPDDILVFFFKDGLNPEGMWVRHEKLNDETISGVLLNNPNQDFGASEGDNIDFYITFNDDKSVIAFVKL